MNIACANKKYQGATFESLNGGKKVFKVFYMVIVLFFAVSQQSISGDNPVYISSTELNQGGVIFIKITKSGNDEPEVRWMDKEINLLYRSNKKIYEGFIAADLEQEPGTYDLKVTFKPSDMKKQIRLTVKDRDYGVRNITIRDNSKVDLNEKDLARATKEKTLMDSLWLSSASLPYWENPFIMPLESKITGTFGRRSIINDQPRSPHTGVDMQGKKGTSVKASNSGKVVLTGNHFFTGNTVVIDHGAGILSMYFHLDKINVKKDEKISRGSVLGTVGSTGRATGAHLHWGFRVNGERVDPVNLVEISRKLEE